MRTRGKEASPTRGLDHTLQSVIRPKANLPTRPHRLRGRCASTVAGRWHLRLDEWYGFQFLGLAASDLRNSSDARPSGAVRAARRTFEGYLRFLGESA